MPSVDVVIVDYGLGNLHSLRRAFKQHGVEPTVSEDVSAIQSADAIVLPGVGSFASGMRELNKRGLTTAVKQTAAAGAPMLGVCLGAQLLMEEGHEFGKHVGLGIVPGVVLPFPRLRDEEKVPHVGWSEITRPSAVKWDHTILHGLPATISAYFVHSYYLNPKNLDNALGYTTYGDFGFTSVIRIGNVYGCQFHPENSGSTGLRIIKNFIKLAH